MRELQLPDYIGLVEEIQQGESQQMGDHLEQFWGKLEPILQSEPQSAVNHLTKFATCVTELSVDAGKLPATLNDAYTVFIRSMFSIQDSQKLKEQFCIFCHRVAACFSQHYADSGFQRIAKIQAYMREHLADDLSLKTVSERFYMNSAYLSRLFREKIGMTFSEYLAEQRIAKAKDLLITSSDSILVIAQNVGYQEANSFSRLFKKHTGMSPQKFRKENGSISGGITIETGEFDMGPCVFANDDFDYADTFLHRE